MPKVHHIVLSGAIVAALVSGYAVVHSHGLKKAAATTPLTSPSVAPSPAATTTPVVTPTPVVKSKVVVPTPSPSPKV